MSTTEGTSTAHPGLSSSAQAQWTRAPQNRGMTNDDQPNRLATPRIIAGVAWVAVPVYCFGQAVGLMTHFFGESATRAEEAQAARWLEYSVTASLALAAAGLFMSLGRRVARRFWLVALVLSVVFAGLVMPQIGSLSPPAVTKAPPGHGACQERSGGDNNCPGG